LKILSFKKITDVEIEAIDAIATDPDSLFGCLSMDDWIRMGHGISDEKV
jgi:hypothetical protein